MSKLIFKRKGNFLAKYGYARVSTKGQAKDGNGLEAQCSALENAGATIIYKDAFTGTNTKRPELDKLIKLLQAGDEKCIIESNDAEDVLDTYGLMESSTMENPMPIQNSKNADADLPEETIKTKQSCTEHRMKVVQTSIQEEYTFYNYVTDSLECEMCGYRESCDHRAAKAVDETIIMAEEAILAEKVNLLRSSEGLPFLWVDSEWNLWAERRAHEISINYGHLGWTNAIGNTYTLAENIAAGQPSGSDFFYAFCNSSPHRSAMLKENAVGIAVSIYIGANGTPYCAMVLLAER